MEKAGFVDLVGKEFFCDHIDDALELAKSLEQFVQETNLKREVKKIKKTDEANETKETVEQSEANETNV